MLPTRRYSELEQVLIASLPEDEYFPYVDRRGMLYGGLHRTQLKEALASRHAQWAQNCAAVRSQLGAAARAYGALERAMARSAAVAAAGRAPAGSLPAGSLPAGSPAAAEAAAPTPVSAPASSHRWRGAGGASGPPAAAAATSESMCSSACCSSTCCSSTCCSSTRQRRTSSGDGGGSSSSSFSRTRRQRADSHEERNAPFTGEISARIACEDLDSIAYLGEESVNASLGIANGCCVLPRERQHESVNGMVGGCSHRGLPESITSNAGSPYASSPCAASPCASSNASSNGVAHGAATAIGATGGGAAVSAAILCSALSYEGGSSEAIGHARAHAHAHARAHGEHGEHGGGSKAIGSPSACALTATHTPSSNAKAATTVAASSPAGPSTGARNGTPTVASNGAAVGVAHTATSSSSRHGSQRPGQLNGGAGLVIRAGSERALPCCDRGDVPSCGPTAEIGTEIGAEIGTEIGAEIGAEMGSTGSNACFVNGPSLSRPSSLTPVEETAVMHAVMGVETPHHASHHASHQASHQALHQALHQSHSPAASPPRSPPRSYAAHASPDDEDDEMPASWMDVVIPRAVWEALGLDVAPFTVQASAPMHLVHFYFSQLTLNCVFVVDTGRFVGMINKTDMVHGNF